MMLSFGCPCRLKVQVMRDANSNSRMLKVFESAAPLTTRAKGFDAAYTTAALISMTRAEMSLLASRRAAPLACQSRGGLTPVLLDGTLWRLLELLTKALRRAVAYALFTGRSTVQVTQRGAHMYR